MTRVWALVAAGFVWRALVAALTPVPAEDGVNYLWMAQQFAAGHAGAALGEVFPPGLPLAIAPLLALGVDPFRAGQAVLCVCGALATFPIARAAERLQPGSGVVAALLAFASPLPVRAAGEVYAEPLFVLLGALAADAGLRGRWWRAGGWSGAAFLVRPEAALLPLAFAAAHLLRRRRISEPPFAWWPMALSCLLFVLALGAWRAALGHGFDPVPKLAFNWEKGTPGAGSLGGAFTAWGANLLRLPWLWLEAFQLMGLLAWWGMTRRRPLGAARPLVWLLLFVALVIAAFVPRRRFFVGWLFAVAPFAAFGLLALPSRVRPWLVALVLVLHAALGVRVVDRDRVAERDVAAFAAARLAPGRTVASDMTRVLWFAGQRPLPPRHFDAGELVAMARAREVQVVVLGTRREWSAAVREALVPEFVELALPEPLQQQAQRRGIAVFERVGSSPPARRPVRRG